MQRASSVRVVVAVGVVGAGLMAAWPATAQADTGVQRLWDGGPDGTGTDFNLAENWTGDTAPAVNDNADFVFTTPTFVPSPDQLAANQLLTLSAPITTSQLGIGANAIVYFDLNGKTYTANTVVGVNAGTLSLQNNTDAATLNTPYVQIADGGHFSTGGAIAGTLSINAGTTEVGVEAGAGGQLDVANHVTWTNSGNLNVGASKNGLLSISGGGKVYGPGASPAGLTYSPSQVTIGAATGVTGTVGVHDAGSLLRANTIVVGGRGTGYLSVDTGGQIDAGVITLGYNSGASATLTIDHGTLSADSFAALPSRSTIIFNAGELNLTGVSYVPQGLTVGDGGADAATLTINSKANTSYYNNYTRILNNHYIPNLTIASNGVVNLENGDLVAAITNNGGQFNWTGGSLSLVTPSTATVTIGSGQLLGDNVTLGETGRRSLNVSNLIVDGAAAQVTLNHGGTLQTQTILTTNGGSFTYNGGSLNLANSDLTIGSGGLIPNDVTLNLGDSIKLDTNVHSTNGNLTIGAGKSVTLAGGTLAARTLTNNGTFAYGGGSLSLTTGDVSIGSTIVGTAANPNTVTIGSSGSVYVPASHTVIEDGKTLELKLNGIFTTASISKVGTGALTFNGGGTLSVNSSTPFVIDTPAADGGVIGSAMPANATIRATQVQVSHGTFTVGADTSLSASAVTVDSGSQLMLDGGSLAVATSLSGDFAWNTGTLSVKSLDLNRIADGTNNHRDYYTYYDYYENHAVTVNASLGSLPFGSTLALANGQHLIMDTLLSGQITVAEGATLDIYRALGGSYSGPGTINVHYVRYDTPNATYASDITAQNIEFAANAKLLPGVKAIGRVAIASGVTLSGGGHGTNSTTDGAATVQGELVNDGVLSPGNSPGVYDVVGNYTQSALGTLNIELNGGSVAGVNFDLLNVLDDPTTADTTEGVANLGGTLKLVTLDGYQGKLGDSFKFLDALALSGAFASLDASAAGLLNASGTKWALSYDFSNGDVYAQVVTKSSLDGVGAPVPEPAALSLLAAASAMMRRRRR